MTSDTCRICDAWRSRPCKTHTNRGSKSWSDRHRKQLERTLSPWLISVFSLSHGVKRWRMTKLSLTNHWKQPSARGGGDPDRPNFLVSFTKRLKLYFKQCFQIGSTWVPFAHASNQAVHVCISRRLKSSSSLRDCLTMTVRNTTSTTLYAFDGCGVAVQTLGCGADFRRGYILTRHFVCALSSLTPRSICHWLNYRRHEWHWVGYPICSEWLPPAQKPPSPTPPWPPLQPPSPPPSGIDF